MSLPQDMKNWHPSQEYDPALIMDIFIALLGLAVVGAMILGLLSLA